MVNGCLNARGAYGGASNQVHEDDGKKGKYLRVKVQAYEERDEGARSLGAEVSP